ncbi:MAG: DUF559 domain-containing protein [Alphaproteobacteria bacterium]|nr:DUF559 domain-containing protein [Alphaproteobacteria bacterium]
MRTYRSKLAARRMRHDPTEAEQRLWSVLRNKQLQDYKFRRQHPIGSYIADFACLSHRLVVEADGGQHADNVFDEKRTTDLERWGWQVVRFWNSDILGNTEGVFETLLKIIKDRHVSPYMPPMLELIGDNVDDV